MGRPFAEEAPPWERNDEATFANELMEAQLLAALHKDPAKASRLNPAWLMHPLHIEIARGMASLAATGETKFERSALLAAIGRKPGDKLEGLVIEGRAIATVGDFLRYLNTQAGLAASPEFYMRELQALWLRRQIKQAAGYSNGGSAVEGITELWGKLEALRSTAGGQAHAINCSDEETFMHLAPPDYLVEGLIQRGFLYGLTGLSGIGKTNVALRMALSITQGQAIGPHAVTDPGPVLYLIGENPDDWRYRLLGLKAFENVAETGIRNVLGPSDLVVAYGMAKAHIAKHGPVRAIVVDTSVAHLPGGTEENDNPAMLAHAKALRHMTELDGRPAVIVICHPPRHGVTDASMLIPRGASSFFAELDGNFTLWGSGNEPMEFHFNKMRGPMFAPIMFEHVTFFCPEVVDARGVQQSCVAARVMSKGAQAAYEARHSAEQEELMLAVLAGLDSGPAIAKHCGWYAGGEPDRKKAMRVRDELKGFVEIIRNRYTLTKRGLAEAERIRDTRASTPHAYKDD